MFAMECWCSTAEQGEKLLGLGRITTSGLGSILYGGYALLCAPKFPIIMADGKLPLRDLSTGQIRGHLSVLLAAGTSVQIENLKAMRSDLKQIILEDQAKSDLLINESLQGESVEEMEQLTSQLDLEKESNYETSPISMKPGISCTISIGHTSNLHISPGRSTSVSLETQEGPVSTLWSSEGKWNFQKSCLLADPLPESLLFRIYSCVSEVNENTPLNEVQSREFGWIEMPLHTLGIGFPCINGWYEEKLKYIS